MADQFVGNDWRSIRKHLGLSPKQYLDIMALNERRPDCLNTKVEVFKCGCRSVWCPKCGKGSPTNKVIQERLSEFNWRLTRHVILTVNRERSAEESFRRVTDSKAIPRLVRSLKMSHCRWLWILEFHRGGFPHWHLLIESDRGMIGKKEIEGRWDHGLCWESYIQSPDHWGAIVGYHRKKGYLAGEKKGHQIVLPDFLISSSRVRKFACNFSPNKRRPPNPTLRPKKRSVSKSYAERFATCDTKCKICINESVWADIPGAYSEGISQFVAVADRIDYKTFHIDRDILIRALATVGSPEK